MRAALVIIQIHAARLEEKGKDAGNEDAHGGEGAEVSEDQTRVVVRAAAIDLAQDQARHQARVEKILEDALLKISVVISDLFGASGRRFLDALVAGSAARRRWPRSATSGSRPPASSWRRR